MKKAKKQVKDLVGLSFLGAGASVGLGAIGGAAATHGQQGITNMSGFMPTMGSMVGAGMMMRSLNVMEKPIKKQKRRR